jgi:hypothetical protein
MIPQADSDASWSILSVGHITFALNTLQQRDLAMILQHDDAQYHL